MVPNHSDHKKKVIVKTTLVFSLFLFFVLSNLIFLHYNRQTVFDRLEMVADFASEVIGKEMLEPEGAAVREKLLFISQKYNIQSFELYGYDGSLVARSNEDGEKSLPVVFEEKNYGGLPFSTTYLHTHILLRDKTPVGYLFLYVTENYRSWGVVVALSCALFLLGTFCVFTKLTLDSQPTALQKSRPTSPRVSVKVLEEYQKQAFIERELICKQRDDALTLAKRKGDFLANMSHEIRTLLNGVIGVLSLLRKSNLDGEKRRLINTATRSADSLLLIIGDILDFSKIEADKLVFEKIPFNLREVVEESISLFTDSALAKKIGLHCYLPTEIETDIIGDPTRLRQILSNFLSNGIKFTEKGEVNLRISLLEHTVNRQKLLFSVEDTGVGIEEDKIGELFTMFTQADQTTSRKYGGSGLGLSVCKSLVELQHGEIGVDSVPGQGASFWFSLSFEISEEKSLYVTDALHDKTIIYYDACETCKTIISQYLSGCDLLIESDDESESILRNLSSHKGKGVIPDIVLVDNLIVRSNLEDFVTSFTSLYGEEAPMLYLFVRYEKITAEMRQLGVTGVIYKPIRLLQLYDVLLGHGEESWRGLQHNELKKNLTGLALLVDDEPINLRVGEMILKKLGLGVELARNGREAVEKTSKKRYDYVLMDIQMPEMSGIEATEQIRAREKQQGDEPQIILALTANVLPSIKEKCMQVGMQGFIAKPIKADILYRHLYPWSKSSEEPQMPLFLKDSSDFDEGDPIEDNKIWDREVALSFVGGDAPLLDDLVKLFLARKQGLQSELKNAVEQENRDEIGNVAHAVKGAVNHFAAGKCRLLAQTIEKEAPYKTIEELLGLVTELIGEMDILSEELAPPS